MKIIDNLIDDLSDNSISLTDILIKTKILAHRTNNDELKKWIHNELNGYPKNAILPTYRILKCQVLGTVSNGFNRLSNYPIPKGDLDETFQQYLSEAPFSESISTVEGFHSSSGEKIGMPISPDFYGYLSKNFTDGFVLEYAQKVFDKRSIVQILTGVRSKLLDFILILSDELGDRDDTATIKDEKSVQKFENLFHSTVFGDNTVVIVGNNNQTNTKFISKGNFDSLEKTFSKNGIPKSDIVTLKHIIDSDNPDSQTKTFGSKVNGWIAEMINKSLSGTWEMGLGAAGSLLADAIKRYYGW